MSSPRTTASRSITRQYAAPHVWLLLCLTTTWTMACSSGPTKKSLGDGCTLNTDCSGSLVCTFGRCHTACAGSKDCPAGQSCVKDSSNNAVCQLPVELECTKDGDCATPLVCGADNKCRGQCTKDSDCTPGQKCSTSMTCAEPTQVDSNNNLIVSGDGGLGGSSGTGGAKNSSTAAGNGTAGSSSAGASNSGGTTSDTSSTGGASNTAGNSAAGGASNIGGTSAKGGSGSGTGGVTSMGGTVGVGGASSTGTTSRTGGTTSVAGASSIGGTTNVGTSATNIGGTSNVSTTATSNGGTSSIGGTTSATTGGAPATGGKPSTGGVAPTGGTANTAGGQGGAGGGTTCMTGLNACGTTCVDLTNDLKNCGQCGNACGQGQICKSGACTTIVGCGVPPGNTAYFCDDFEAGPGRWTVTGVDWWTTVSNSYSPIHSFTNNPNGSYVAGSLAQATLTSSIDLSSAIHPQLSYWQHYSMTANVYLAISKDAGLTWTSSGGYTNGTIPDWRNVVVDLKSYAGTSILLRFALDGGSAASSWYIDDVMVREFQ
jgi:hypothetical protein